MITLKSCGQTLQFVVQPSSSVWDAQQVNDLLDAQGNPKGRGDFDVDGYRIFAVNQRVASAVARRLSESDVKAR